MCVCVISPRLSSHLKFQVLVYNICPPTFAITGYTTCLRVFADFMEGAAAYNFRGSFSTWMHRYKKCLLSDVTSYDRIWRKAAGK